MRLSAVQAATIAIALVVVAQAALRLAQPEFNILRFAVLGWPPWALWVVSGAELLGAALLIRAGSFSLGAWMLAAVAGAFIWTYARLGVPEAGLGWGGMLLALAGLAMLRRRLA